MDGNHYASPIPGVSDDADAAALAIVDGEPVRMSPDLAASERGQELAEVARSRGLAVHESPPAPPPATGRTGEGLGENGDTRTTDPPGDQRPVDIDQAMELAVQRRALLRSQAFTRDEVTAMSAGEVRDRAARLIPHQEKLDKILSERTRRPDDDAGATTAPEPADAGGPNKTRTTTGEPIATGSDDDLLGEIAEIDPDLAERTRQRIEAGQTAQRRLDDVTTAGKLYAAQRTLTAEIPQLADEESFRKVVSTMARFDEHRSILAGNDQGAVDDLMRDAASVVFFASTSTEAATERTLRRRHQRDGQPELGGDSPTPTTGLDTDDRDALALKALEQTGWKRDAAERLLREWTGE
jgi:hypothetical protein